MKRSELIKELNTCNTCKVNFVYNHCIYAHTTYTHIIYIHTHLYLSFIGTYNDPERAYKRHKIFKT